MPNELKIQIRGPSYKIMHSDLYGPGIDRGFEPGALLLNSSTANILRQGCRSNLGCRAEALPANLLLSRKMWMECAKEALLQLTRKLPGQAGTGKILTMGRCARHSKFPECTECQERRKAWMSAVKQRAPNKELVERLYNAMLEHQEEWSKDRHEAIAMRYASYLSDSPDLYQCDDKCGSFWQCLPVDITGRLSKATASAVYRFAVQANVVCGAGGVLRFAVPPLRVLLTLSVVYYSHPSLHSVFILPHLLVL